MKQRMEVLVLTEVDHNKQIPIQKYEAELKKHMQEACKEVLGVPFKHTTVIIEYGDPV